MDEFQCHAVGTDCSRAEEGFGIGKRRGSVGK